MERFGSKFNATPAAPAAPPEEGHEKILTVEEQKELDHLLQFESLTRPEPAQQSPEACAEMIEELENLYAAFEQNHDLEALRAITELTIQEAPSHPIREPAHIDLAPMVALLNRVEKQQTVPREKVDELLKQYRYLVRAVREFNRGVLDHTRP